MAGPFDRKDPALFEEFPTCTSKEARANLPSLVDEVVDSGTPVLITKLNKGRAAVIPARHLLLWAIASRLGIDMSLYENDVEELMSVIHERSEKWLEDNRANPVTKKDGKAKGRRQSNGAVA